jgi:heme-degrading monooxygenase HmoA
MVIMRVRVRSGLSFEELMRVAEERAPEFRKLPGLIQKYYARDAATGELWGVYLWDSHESLAEFRASELARSIPTAYDAVEEPERAVADVIMVLRA